MPNFAKLTGSGAVPNTAVRRISHVASAGGVGGRSRRAVSAGGVGTSEAWNKRTGAAVEMGTSGMSALGLESGFGFLGFRVQFPLKSLFGLGARTSRIVTAVEL